MWDTKNRLCNNQNTWAFNAEPKNAPNNLHPDAMDFFLRPCNLFGLLGFYFHNSPFQHICFLMFAIHITFSVKLSLNAFVFHWNCDFCLLLPHSKAKSGTNEWRAEKTLRDFHNGNVLSKPMWKHKMRSEKKWLCKCRSGLMFTPFFNSWIQFLFSISQNFSPWAFWFCYQRFCHAKNWTKLNIAFVRIDGREKIKFQHWIWQRAHIWKRNKLKFWLGLCTSMKSK